jgi:hypothetical protein
MAGLAHRYRVRLMSDLGRWQKQPALGVRLLWPDNDGSSTGKTILYAWISDDIDFEQDAERNGTITFCYENNRGERATS